MSDYRELCLIREFSDTAQEALDLVGIWSWYILVHILCTANIYHYLHIPIHTANFKLAVWIKLILSNPYLSPRLPD